MIFTLRAPGYLEPRSDRKRMFFDDADRPSGIEKLLHFAPLPSLAWWTILGDENKNLDLRWLVRWAWYRFRILNRSGLNC